MTHPLPQLFFRLCQRTAGLALLLLALAAPAWAGLSVNGDATVTDSTTGLVWDQCPYGLSGATCATGTALHGSWAGALSAAVAANTANYKGFNDWRVPNKNELESIAKLDTYTSGQPAIDTTAFPGTPLAGFWASTTYALMPSYAWFVGFSSGHIGSTSKTSANYVRLVRSGQSFASFDLFPLTSQTITFANPGAQTFGATPTLTATASSGLTPSFTSATTGICTITSGGVLTFVTVGTCTIAADQAGNANFYAAQQVSQSFAVGQASQTITFGAAPSVIVGGSGTVSTTGGASGIARVYASTTPAACTVNASTGVVTGVAAGSNNCTITANQAGNTNYGAAAQASQSFGIGAAPVVTPPEPTIALLPVTMGGLSTLPAILNMADGDGPAFMAALVGMLSNAVGQPLQFVEQNARGTVTLRGFNGGYLAFIPHGFQTGDNRADGVYPVGNGQYHAVFNGRQVSLAPALVNLDQLIALLPSLVASQADNGVMTATLNGETYVVQAGPGVQRDVASGSAQLAVGTDGLLHFIDAMGNNQILYPAFAEPATLRSILLGMDPGATQSVQLDGTATIVFNGLPYTLVPDLTLGPIPTGRVGQSQWQEGPGRYRVVNVQVPFGVQSSQGFTVKP